MRSFDQRRDGLFSYVRPESRIPSGRPLRLIRRVADEALSVLNEQFAVLQAELLNIRGVRKLVIGEKAGRHDPSFATLGR